jgi:membrane associated rhomboid family serine protease
MKHRTDAPNFGAKLKLHITVLSFFIALFYGVETVDWLLGGALNQYGIHPRNVDRLSGIAFAPFLHGDFTHLMGNTLPFLVLGWLVLIRGVGRFFLVFLTATVTAGAGTWLIGAENTVHIGASGVIFGFLGYLLLISVFERSVTSILLSLAVGALYGGYLFGVLPGTAGVSWEGHLFGFLGGVMAARLSRPAPSHRATEEN